MPTFALTMPKLSPTMTEGVIAKWHKKEGEFVDAGELLLEVSTDKATVEYNAIDEGWLRVIQKKESEKAEVNEPLALFTTTKDEAIEQKSTQAIKKDTSQEKPQEKPQEKVQEQAATVASITTSHQETRIFASPLARRIAKDQNIDLSRISGTGPSGRIMKRDLESAQSAQKPSGIPSAQPTVLHTHKEERITLSPMRKVIAERLSYSKAHIPHFYIRQEINVEKILEMREELKKQNFSFTVNDFFVKAIAIALQKHPEINCTYDEKTQTITRYRNVDISIAVTIPGGLITPIVRFAEQKTLSQISQEVKQLVQKAKDNKLQPNEFQGGTFTISNLGMFGITDFDAIVNPPQGAILAIGAAYDAPVVKNGTLIPGKLVKMTLSCDHRIIDGAEAAQFMKTLKMLLETPILFLAQL